MKKLLFAEIQGDGLRLTDAAGGTVSLRPPDSAGAFAARHRKETAIVVSRLDYDLHVIEIPPLPARELRDLIRYRLRVIYPGSPAETVFDFRILDGRGEMMSVAVYLLRRGIFDVYRACAEAGALTTADALLDAAGRKRRGEVVIAASGYVERLVYRAGILADSRVKRRRDASEGGSETPPLSLCARELEALRRGRRRFFRLLLPGRRYPLGRGVVGAVVLATAALTLFAGYFVRAIDGLQQRLDRTVARYEQLEKSGAGNRRQNEDYEAVMAAYRKTISRRPVDAYGLFAGVASAVSGQALKVDRLSYTAGRFTIEARGSDPFNTASTLSERPGFHSVQIAQIVPLESAGDGRSVLFTVSGDYDGR